MFPTRCASTRTFFGTALLLTVIGCPAAPPDSVAPMGTLALTITDAATGESVPARVEIQDADGAYHVATDALRVGGDCDMSDEGAGYVDLESTLAGFSDHLDNPYTASTQFYSEGTSSVRLPIGSATIRVWKGSEYKLSVATIEIPTSDTVERTLALERWTDMPSRGWYSADDHLHIPRPTRELDRAISQMMQAEDIHVANLLQMGKVENFAIARQHAQGPASYFQDGNFILAAGQENPRSHFLGHTITLGAATAHHDPSQYLIYRLLWQKTAAEGALNGFAHAWAPSGSMIAPQDGMAVVAPYDLVRFAEVLQFNRSGYDAWYDLLALGFRVTPTAGTDYPCADQTLPGHERFYTKVEGSLTYPKWLEGVRRGRTFVTTGPVIDFRVGGEEMGGEVLLAGPASVEISGKATFDPAGEDLEFLELVQNGDVVERYSRIAGASEIEFETSLPVDESSWFALRGYGVRRENSIATPVQFSSLEPTSNVHSAAIYVTLEQGPGIEQSPRARRIARTWLARLEDLERMLAEKNLQFLAARLAFPNADAVPEKTLLESREALLEEIRASETFFRERAR